MYVHGLLDREPLPYAPDVVWYQVGATAAAATMGAVFVSQRQGVGQQVDVSAQEALIGNVDSRSLFYEYTGVKTSRERWPGGIPQGAYPCQDGYVVMGVGYDVYFRRLCEAMGMPEVAKNPRFAESEDRSRNAEEFDALFIEWLMQHTKREVFALCQAHKVMCAPVLTFEELLEDPQLKARGSFGRVNASAGGGTAGVGGAGEDEQDAVGDRSFCADVGGAYGAGVEGDCQDWRGKTLGRWQGAAAATSFGKHRNRWRDSWWWICLRFGRGRWRLPCWETWGRR